MEGVELPSDWYAGPVRAQQAVGIREQDLAGVHQTEEQRFQVLVERELHNVVDNDYPKEELALDSLVSRLPYKKMLADLFGATNLEGHLTLQDVPYVTKAYEESFMREKVHANERECTKGALCECMFIDRQQPFVGVEFILPGEKQQGSPQMCVLCCRATTQQLYYDIVFDKENFVGCIQRFGNIHSQPGEYNLQAMLIASSTAPVHLMPLPIVLHQRNRYSVYVQAGVKRLKQHRVHFQNTPSCPA